MTSKEECVFEALLDQHVLNFAVIEQYHDVVLKHVFLPLETQIRFTLRRLEFFAQSLEKAARDALEAVQELKELGKRLKLPRSEPSVELLVELKTRVLLSRMSETISRRDSTALRLDSLWPLALVTSVFSSRAQGEDLSCAENDRQCKILNCLRGHDRAIDLYKLSANFPIEHAKKMLLLYVGQVQDAMTSHMRYKYKNEEESVGETEGVGKTKDVSARPAVQAQNSSTFGTIKMSSNIDTQSTAESAAEPHQCFAAAIRQHSV